MKEYSVGGMSCAACSARVEQAVSRLEGVESCSVSLLTNSMRIEGSVSPEAVIAAVKKAGYVAAEKGNPRVGDKGSSEEKKENLLPALLWSVALLFLLMTLSMGHMLGASLPVWLNPMAQGMAQWMLSSAILLIHRRFFLRGFSALLHRAPNMDTLVSLGSGVSYLYSVVLLFLMTEKSGSEQMALLHGLYFESAAMILVLITVGKMLEEKSRGKTTSAIRALKELAPQSARVIRDGAERILSPEEVVVGDQVVVLPGENFPVDGEVLEGESAVDESALSGESIPVDKKRGDSVYSGTGNRSGRLICRAVRVGEETALSAILERVSAASASKAPIARLADRVSGVFVPVVMALALLTFLIHWGMGSAVEAAMARGITVLVISCPCALGLATPVAIMVANGVAARRGILFKTAASLEEAGRTQIVVLDKTGTITTGKMKVDRLIPFGEVTEEELLRAAATLEQASAHPLAKAVLEYAKQQNILPEAAEQFETHAGSGVSALWKAQILLGGKETFLKGKIPPEASRQAQELSSQGKTPLFFSHGERYLGLITVSDTVKPDSAAAVADLKRMGIRVIMLTGDREEVGRSVAQTVGIEEYHAGVLPMEKEDRIASLKKEGKVCMVGDGINDAPALVQADLGVAVGGGLDAAMDAAEVVLMRSTLSDLPLLIRLSQKTLKNIKENLFWAFCYNLLGIPLAAGVFHAWLGWDLNPMFGAAAMSLSSFCVVTNALRLYWFSDGKEKNKNSKKEKKEMEKVMKIQGMMCPHCEAHVKKALENLDGVEQVEASHQKGEARLILSKNVSDSLLKETVEKEGYRVL